MNLRSYYLLTKPGIILGNAVTATGGFALASKGRLNPSLFFFTLLGLSLIVASGCVANNYLDRHSDQKMARTRHRPLATGTIPPVHALIESLLLLLSGALLLFQTNLLTTLIALFGFLVYVAIYTIWKHKTLYGTAIGSIAGAIPPVIGYSAVTNQLDLAALLLFLIVVFWQMPHFFAIAMYRFDDYAAASIPVFPVVRGMHAAKIRILSYIVAFTLSSSMLTLSGYVGYAYLTVASLLGLGWLWLALQGFKSTNDTLWARKMFLSSLIVIMALSLMMSVDGFY
ncbi:MAG: heme o synthase [Chlamydiales bacterium]